MKGYKHLRAEERIPVGSFGECECPICHSYRDKGLSPHAVAENSGRSHGTVVGLLRAHGTPTRNQSEAQVLRCAQGRGTKSGAAHHQWRGGRWIGREGYVMVRGSGPYIPRGCNYDLEHRRVWENTHGESLPDGHVVHHLNGIRADNRPENLEAMPKLGHNRVFRAKARRIRELEQALLSARMPQPLRFISFYGEAG